MRTIVMQRKQLVDSVSKEFNIKSGRARKIVDHVLCQILESGLSGEGFTSPILRVVSKDVPENVVNTPEGAKAIPAQKIMRLRQAKAYVSPLQKKAPVNDDSSQG